MLFEMIPVITVAMLRARCCVVSICECSIVYSFYCWWKLGSFPVWGFQHSCCVNITVSLSDHMYKSVSLVCIQESAVCTSLASVDADSFQSGGTDKHPARNEHSHSPTTACLNLWQPLLDSKHAIFT